jgi:hypothetical protein
MRGAKMIRIYCWDIEREGFRGARVMDDGGDSRVGVEGDRAGPMCYYSEYAQEKAGTTRLEAARHSDTSSNGNTLAIVMQFLVLYTNCFIL